MLVRTPADLGAAIRDRRKQLKLDQATFAKRIGASRQWVIEIERGHPRAELGLALRALDVLDIHLDTKVDQGKRFPAADDIDAILAKARKSGP
jgi:HTH-type transcriptional regulator / antitoxin HipB